MRICIFEDQRVGQLEPTILTRPVGDLWCGPTTLLNKHRHLWPCSSLGLLLRPYLAEQARLEHPFLAINDPLWLQQEPTIMVNGRWLPPAHFTLPSDKPHIGIIDQQLAYALLPAHLLTYCSPHTIDDCVETWMQILPACHVEGAILNYPWQLIEHHARSMSEDHVWLTAMLDHGYYPSQLKLHGPSASLCVHPTAEIEPWVYVDTTRGPVIIEREVTIEAFSRIEGPCYLGAGCVVKGAKIRRSTLGPMCRVGGEIDACLLQGFVTKEHEGYLGHSYVGAWVEIAAGVQVGDHRLDAEPVRVHQLGRTVEVGHRHVGAFIGDHTEIGAGTLINTGSCIGAFCELAPIGHFLPSFVPSFCRVNEHGMHSFDHLGDLFLTAALVMQQMGWTMTPEHEALFRQVHAQTARERRYLARLTGNEMFLRSA